MYMYMLVVGYVYIVVGLPEPGERERRVYT